MGIELIIKNTAQRINILLLDANGDPVDATNGPHLIVMDTGDNILHYDAFPAFTLTGTVSVSAGTAIVTGVSTLFTDELVVGDTVTIAAEARVVLSIASNTLLTLATNHTAGASGVTATKATRIVKPASTVGQYYLLYGDRAAPVNNPDQSETNCTGDRLFLWRATGTAGTEEINIEQVVKVISARTARMLPYMRTMIDKAGMLVDEDPLRPCPTGYTDAQLIQFLEGGLQAINAYEPYPVWCRLDEFPFDTFGQMLIESSLVVGVFSQQMFAIVTDVPNYSDQGNSFVIQHAPQLAAYLNQVSARLDKLIPLMKSKFVRSGQLHIESGGNFRLQQLMQAAPSGALFRNMYFIGN